MVYSKGFGSKLTGFSSYSIPEFPNVKFMDLDLDSDNHFKVDDHLNPQAGFNIAIKLYKIIKEQ